MTMVKVTSSNHILAGLSIAFFMVCAILTVYVLGSIAAWNRSVDVSTESLDSLRTETIEVFSDDKSATQSLAELSTLIDEWSEKDFSTSCQLNWLFEWQSALPHTHDARQNCLDAYAQIDTILQTGSDVVDYINTANAVATEIQDIQDDSATDDFENQSSIWQNLSEDESLTQTEVFADTGLRVQQIASSIAKAYAALYTADEAQDIEAYDAALADLQNAYNSLTEINDINKNRQAELTQKFNESVNSY